VSLALRKFATMTRHALHAPLRGLVVLSLIATSFGVLPALSQTLVEEGGLRAVDRLERMPADAIKALGDKIVPPDFFAPIGSTERSSSQRTAYSGTLLEVPHARQLWQFFEYDDNGTKTAVAVRSLDTLKILDTFVINGTIRRGASSNFGGEWISASDGKHRVFLAAANRSVIVVDTRSFEVRQFNRPEQLGLPPLGGMVYDPHQDRVILVFAGLGGTSVGNAQTTLYQVNPTTGEYSTPRPVRSCNGPLPSTENGTTYQVAPYVADGKYVYVPCQRSGNSGSVIRIERNTMWDPASAEEVVVGPTNLATVLTDTGSGRMFLITLRGEIWAFDTASMSFVGVVGANSDRDIGARLGYGVDPVTGRLFFQSETFGLGVVDGRFFPIPQAKTRLDLIAPGQERLIADAPTKRLFVLTGAAVEKDYAYTIYELPEAPVPPPPPDPDGNTTDQPEVPGVSEGRYNASASGYGTRVVLANGVSTLAPAPSVGDLAPTADALANNLNPKCGFSDRELLAGRVKKSEADTGTTLAEAIAVDLDPRTKLDLEKPSRCEPYGKDQNGTDRLEEIFATTPEPFDNPEGREPRWNRDPAVCSTSEGDQREKAVGNDHGATPLGTSEVDCPTPGKGDLSSSAQAKLSGPVSVGDALARTSISRDGPGIRSRAEAVASDVRLGGGIWISEIRSTATSFAHGRPQKDEMSKHVVTVEGLEIDADLLSNDLRKQLGVGAATGRVKICGVCDVSQVVDVLNRVLAGRAQFRTGTGAADAGLVDGSDRGALTAVQKSPERQVSDQSLVGDFTTEIPGLEMVVYNDNSKWGRARQLYQFAGVATSSTYNIVGVPKSGDFSDLLDDALSDGIDGIDGGVPGGVDGGIPDSGVDTGGGSGDDDGGDGIIDRIKRAFRAVGRGARLFFTSPRHAMLLLTGWALFILPAVLYKRRLTLAELG